MTVTAIEPRAHYTGDGATVAFAVGFRVDHVEDLRVYSLADGDTEPTLHVYGREWITTGDLAAGSGSVVFTTAPADQAAVTILRWTPRVEATDYGRVRFPEPSHERTFDRLTMMCQELVEQLGRTVISVETESGGDGGGGGVVVEDENIWHAGIVYNNGDGTYQIAEVEPAAGGLWVVKGGGVGTDLARELNGCDQLDALQVVKVFDLRNTSGGLARRFVLPIACPGSGTGGGGGGGGVNPDDPELPSPCYLGEDATYHSGETGLHAPIPGKWLAAYNLSGLGSVESDLGAKLSGAGPWAVTHRNINSEDSWSDFHSPIRLDMAYYGGPLGGTPVGFADIPRCCFWIEWEDFYNDVNHNRTVTWVKTRELGSTVGVGDTPSGTYYRHFVGADISNPGPTSITVA